MKKTSGQWANRYAWKNCLRTIPTWKMIRYFFPSLNFEPTPRNFPDPAHGACEKRICLQGSLAFCEGKRSGYPLVNVYSLILKPWPLSSLIYPANKQGDLTMQLLVKHLPEGNVGLWIHPSHHSHHPRWMVCGWCSWWDLVNNFIPESINSEISTNEMVV